MDSAELLRSTGLFDDVDPDLLSALSEKTTWRDYPMGATVMRAGEPGDAFYVVCRGQLEVLVEPVHGSVPVRVGTLGPGDWVGEMALLTGEPRSATVRAVTAARLLRIGRDEFASVVSHVSVYQQLVRRLCARLRRVEETLEGAQAAHAALSRYFRGYDHQRETMVGATSAARSLADAVASAAAADGPVLIEGERGTGKSFVAALIARDSSRSEGPLITIDCAASGENAALELFGFEETSASGRARRQPGALELCSGGTVVVAEPHAATVWERLRSALSTGVYRRVGGSEEIELRARVIVTRRTSADAPPEPRDGAADLFTGGIIRIPPLRDRRRDISVIGTALLERHCRDLGRPAPQLSAGAIERLVSYDWPENAAELSSVMRRAAALAADGQVEADHILIHLPPSGRQGRLDLTRIPWLARCLRSRWYPAALQVPAAAVLGYIVYQCFLGPQDESNVALTLTWPIWWAALPLTFLLFGRIWCTVCPFSLLSSVTQRLYSLSLKVPAFLKRTEIWPMTGLFVFLTWMDEYSHYPDVPMYTGIVLASVLGGTLVCSLLFERRVWCRYLCPLGGVNGVYSTAAVSEVRAATDVCASHCRTHDCVARSSPFACPMLERPMVVDSNRCCNWCMNCLKACPHSAVHVYLRVPGAEIWELRQPMLSAGVLSVLLVGTMLVHSFCKYLHSRGLHLADVPPATWLSVADEGHAWTLAYGLALALSLGVVAGASGISAAREQRGFPRNLAHYGLAFAVMAVLFHIALEGGEFLSEGIPLGIAMIGGAIGGPAEPERYALFTPLFVRVMQVAIGLVAVALTAYAVSHVARQRAGGRTRPGALPHLAVTGLMGVVFLGLLVAAPLTPPVESTEPAAEPQVAAVPEPSESDASTVEATESDAPKPPGEPMLLEESVLPAMWEGSLANASGAVADLKLSLYWTGDPLDGRVAGQAALYVHEARKRVVEAVAGTLDRRTGRLRLEGRATVPEMAGWALHSFDLEISAKRGLSGSYGSLETGALLGAVRGWPIPPVSLGGEGPSNSSR